MLNSTDIQYLQVKVDFETDDQDYTDIEGSADMGGSGDNPCVDRTFISRYLYQCLGDFMKEAYQAKIEQRRLMHKKTCKLFAKGFECFEKKIENDFDVQCSPMDMYNTGVWFKEEVWADFNVDLRRCPYPVRPMVPEPTSSLPPLVSENDSPKTAIVAGVVLGLALIFIAALMFIIICKRRIGGRKNDGTRTVRARPVPMPGVKNVFMHENCDVNKTDTRSTLTGLSSDNSLQQSGYEHLSRPMGRPNSHIYSEIEDMAEAQRLAPVGCSTFMTTFAPPDYINQQDMIYQSLPTTATVNYLQSGEYITVANPMGYQDFNTNCKRNSNPPPDMPYP